jgi:hypothetical protein
MFGSFFDWLGLGSSDSESVNPANGLPMVGALDVEGNPYGVDSGDDLTAGSLWEDDAMLSSSADDFSSSDSWSDDSWSSTSSFDDSFSSFD